MDVKIIKYRSFEKNTLQGFCDVLVNGLKIKDCSHHRKNDQEWVNFPSKSYESEGKTKWYSLIQFEDKADHWKFQETAMAALEEHLAQDHNNTGTDDTPF